MLYIVEYPTVPSSLVLHLKMIYFYYSTGAEGTRGDQFEEVGHTEEEGESLAVET